MRVPQRLWESWVRLNRRSRLLILLTSFVLALVGIALLVVYSLVDSAQSDSLEVEYYTPAVFDVPEKDSSNVSFDQEIQTLRSRLLDLAGDPDAQRALLKEKLFSGRPQPKYFLAGCAKVAMGAELPYVIEWLEYHRLAGFNKIIVYLDDLGLDNSRPSGGTLKKENYRLLDQYYKEVLGEPDFVEIRSTSSLVFDARGDMNLPTLYGDQIANTHRLTQQSLIKACFASLKDKTEWFAHFDVDEFWVVNSTRHGQIPLAEYLKGFYTDQSLNLTALYMTYGVSGIYTPNYNHGLGTTRSIFSPRAAIVRNPVSGSIKFLSESNVFVWPKNSSVDESWEQRRANIRALSEYLKDAALSGRTARDAFIGLMNESRVEQLDHFSLVLDSSTASLPSIRYGNSPVEILDAQASAFPKCKSVLDKFRDADGYEMIRSSKHKQIRERSQSASLECRPGSLHSKLTTMGKSLIWTGLRHEPPRWYEDWKIDLILLDEQRFRLAKTQSKGNLRKDGEDNGVSKVGGNGLKGQPGSVLPVELEIKMRPILDHRRAKSRGGWSDRKKLPLLCYVPWVHGCSHMTKVPLVFSDPELRLNHYMMRSVESRTAGDVGWRKGSSGWGKFNTGANSNDFGVLDFTSTVNHKQLEVVARLKRALTSRFKEHIVLRNVKLPYEHTPSREPDGLGLWVDVCTVCPKEYPWARQKSMCMGGSDQGVIINDSICTKNFN